MGAVAGGQDDADLGSRHRRGRPPLERMLNRRGLFLSRVLLSYSASPPAVTSSKRVTSPRSASRLASSLAPRRHKMAALRYKNLGFMGSARRASMECGKASRRAESADAGFDSLAS